MIVGYPLDPLKSDLRAAGQFTQGTCVPSMLPTHPGMPYSVPSSPLKKLYVCSLLLTSSSVRKPGTHPS
eukprot:CAMPEP_0118854810 /NCGR_PEP_ID=MMETSP1163-20130328/2867_1 /TAXON_ID=124430 /ORGANISM="Phaeomonas parva, Strain CCMP2877" /LENGTH=68 /DNA_ID=CAMNT_0006787587 /DNA_START=915 /DNA_END=1124 /DNA_ORIENTATION=+